MLQKNIPPASNPNSEQTLKKEKIPAVLGFGAATLVVLANFLPGIFPKEAQAETMSKPPEIAQQAATKEQLNFIIKAKAILQQKGFQLMESKHEDIMLVTKESGKVDKLEVNNFLNATEYQGKFKVIECPNPQGVIVTSNTTPDIIIQHFETIANCGPR